MKSDEISNITPVYNWATSFLLCSSASGQSLFARSWASSLRQRSIISIRRAYQSQAKLLVRYVLERSAVDSIDNTTQPNSGLRGGAKTTDTVIDAEVQILTSWDLAAEVASAIGPTRLGARSKEAAAGMIVSGFQVTPVQRKRCHSRFLSESAIRRLRRWFCRNF